jgi:hypothetical protein
VGSSLVEIGLPLTTIIAEAGGRWLRPDAYRDPINRLVVVAPGARRRSASTRNATNAPRTTSSDPVSSSDSWHASSAAKYTVFRSPDPKNRDFDPLKMKGLAQARPFRPVGWGGHTKPRPPRNEQGGQKLYSLGGIRSGIGRAL